MMDAFLQDLRYAVRQLLDRPAFSAVAIVTLSLGIGANTAIFSLVNALLLRPPPQIEDPSRLVLIGRSVNNEGFDTFSYPDIADIQTARSLTGAVAWRTVPMHASGGGATERIRGALVSANYFTVLGTTPAVGRFFLPEEDRVGDPAHVVVLGAGLWMRAFGGSRDVIGSTIRLNSLPFTVIGVAPEGFQGTLIGDQLDVFVPITTQPIMMAGPPSMLGRREAVWVESFGRLAPTATIAQAQEELGGIGRRLAADYPEAKKGWGIAVAGNVGFDPSTRSDVREFLWILQGAVALVLAIACANVANLLLVRASGRRKELAVRSSLGAGRGRIVRQLLTESLVLSTLGGIGGLVLAYWSIDLLRGLPALQFPGDVALPIDARVLGFTLAVSALTGVVFGLAPAIHASRLDLVSELKEGAQAGRQSRRLRNGLVVAQVAVSLVLLVAAGLFVRTLRNAYAIEPGFATRDVVLARLDLGLQGYDQARGSRFQTDLVDRLRALPGVRYASLALNFPFGGGWDTRIAAQGAPIDPEDPGFRTDRNSVSPEYFAAMDIPILRGRGFTDRDVAATPLVTVVNQAIADKLWPGEEPIGKRLVQVGGGPALEVVGVARDAKYRSLFEARRLTFYQPLTQDYHAAIIVHLRSSGDARLVAGSVERAVHELDPDLPVYRVQTLAERLGASLGQQRTAATLVGAFGLLALLLAAIGLYAAVAYTVAQQTREIGIRIALGARSGDVLRQVLRHGLTLSLAGLGIGVAGAFFAMRLVRSQLYQVSPTDPSSFLVVSLLLVAVAVVASLLPARRAARVDPMVALRSE